MREELKYIERIEDYLEGQISGAERAAFEEEMGKSEQLRNDVEFYRNLREGISRQAIKLDIKKAQYRFIKQKKTKARWRKFLLGGGSLIIMLIAVFLIAIPEDELQDSFLGQLFSQEQIEKGGNDFTPVSEFFEIDTGVDTTLKASNGTRVHLPKGSLLLPNGNTPEGPIDIELAEVTNSDDMILAGLNTGNDDEPMESEGMVFFNAKSDGKQLIPNPDLPPYIEIPTEKVIPDAKVYTGKRNKEGGMRWIKPRLPSNFLTPLPFKYLDYYPEGFKQTVEDKLPYGGHDEMTRELLDSLYFGMRAVNKVIHIIGDPRDPSLQKVYDTSYIEALRPELCGIQPAAIQTITQEKFERSLLATREFMERLKYIYQNCDNDLLNLYIDNADKDLWEIDEMAVEYFIANHGEVHEDESLGMPESVLAGKHLFQTHCISCHQEGKSIAAPNLAGLEQRWPNRSEIHQFITNPTSMMEKGHSYLDQVINEWKPKGGIMPAQPVSRNETDYILDYVGTWGAEDHSLSLIEMFRQFAAQKLTNVPNAHIYAQLIERDFAKDIQAFNKEHEKIQKVYREELEQEEKAHEKLVADYKKVVEKRVKTRMKAYGFKVKTMGWKNVARVIPPGAKPYTPPPLQIEVLNADEYDHVHAYFSVTNLNVIGKIHRLGKGLFIMNEHRIINIPRQNADSVTLIAVAYKGTDIYLQTMAYPTKSSGDLSMELEQTPEAEARELLNQHSGKNKPHSIMTDLGFQQKFYADYSRRQRLLREEVFTTELYNVAFPCCTRPIPILNAEYVPPNYDNTNWTEWRTEVGITVVHPDGRKEIILKSKKPALFRKYRKLANSDNTVILE